jgi:hypothetical protein
MTPGLAVGALSFEGEIVWKHKKLMLIVHVTFPGHSETKSNGLTRICMWAKDKYFKAVFFFIPGPFQGGHFLGEKTCPSALDLKPATFVLRAPLLSDLNCLLYFRQQ